MLKKLRIKNIILIESAEIDFEKGLNIVSGETGSGKSAIMNSLHLVAGNKVDSSILRKGEEKGYVEAIFDCRGILGIETFLEQVGITVDDLGELFIKREISQNGRTRAFINNQLAVNNTLKSLATYLFNIVGQHATQDLLSIECHRDILDVYGELKDKISHFSKSFNEEKELEEKLERLLKSESERLREIEICQMEIEEIDEANLKDGEDEDLFNEYSSLAHTEEIGLKADEILHSLSSERMSVLQLLHRHKNTFDSLRAIDAKLEDLSLSYKNAVVELQEVFNALSLYRSRIENNPKKLEEINERLTLIARLKKKYGSSTAEIQQFAEFKRKRLYDLEHADEQIEEIKALLEKIKKQNNCLALELTDLRQKAAKSFSSDLKKELKALNMPHVDFQIDITPQKRQKVGDDRVEFYLLPNKGEHRIPLKDCASGGELSRVMLSLQTVLTGKDGINTLIFDEIDGNIGGETALIVGEKLKVLGINQQVICITHFPQVARYADHHLQISKQTIDERTFSFIQRLDAKAKEKELARMMGISK